MMINNVPLESYLRGVVPHEVSPAWPTEALKTQACAARAFALGQPPAGQGLGRLLRRPRPGLRGRRHRGRAHRRRRPRHGRRLPHYDGKPILATYFSCSGGQTENIELLVWGRAVPYLKGVDDPYDSYGSLHDWGPLRRTPAQIGGPLGASGSLRAVYTVKRGASPRIVKAAIIGSGGTKYIDGGSLRIKLGLNSTWAIFTSMGISPAARDRDDASSPRAAASR